MNAALATLGTPNQSTPILKSNHEALESSLAVGPQATALKDVVRVTDLFRTSADTEFSLSHRAYELKAIFSQVSMHLGREWRQSIFHQIDSILDPDSWDFDDALPELGSWRTLLRLLIYYEIGPRPGLALNDEFPILIWQHNDVRVSLECHSEDRIHWVASRDVEGSIDVAAGETRISHLRDYLTPFNSNNWLINGARVR